MFNLGYTARRWICGRMDASQAFVALDLRAVCVLPAVNLAIALARGSNLRVGLMDADVFGPSIPRMMKLQGKPEIDKGARPQSLYIWP